VVRGAHDDQSDQLAGTLGQRVGSTRLDSSGVCPGFIASGDAAACIGEMRPGSIKIHPMHGVAPRIGS